MNIRIEADPGNQCRTASRLSFRTFGAQMGHAIASAGGHEDYGIGGTRTRDLTQNAARLPGLTEWPPGVGHRGLLPRLHR
jgi:hypothetical protein